MGRRRKEWDSEYKLILQSREKGKEKVCTDTGSSLKKQKLEETKREEKELRDVKEWRYLMKPDWDLKSTGWDSVARIIVDHDISDIDRCPICLSTPPIAPRLANCSHVFCLLCLNKYVELVGTSCPLCSDALYSFKPLYYSKRGKERINVGLKLNFNLCTRAVGSTTVNTKCTSIQNDRIPKFSTPLFGPYIQSSGGVLKQLYQDELDDLEPFGVEEEDKPHYDRTIQLIKYDQSKVINKITIFNNDQDDIYYRFYQPENRQRTFLDPLDVRILLTQFQQYSNFPAQIEGEIRKVEYTKIDKQLKSKSRYLDHLESGTVIRLLSCDWADLVDNDIFEKFKDEISQKHIPKSPKLEAKPFHPEVNDRPIQETILTPEEASAIESHINEQEENTEYLYDPNRDNRTFGDLLSDFGTITKNGRRVVTIGSTRRK